MKLVVDINPSLFERLQLAIDRNNYRSMGDFAILALENQLSLDGGAAATSDERPRNTPQITRPDSQNLNVDDGGDLKLFAPTSAATLSVGNDGWIWGIVNRVLPVKFAVRELHSATGPLPLALAQQRIAESATNFAQQIVANTSNERDRHSTLVTGFPVREPLYPAQQRFANHYVGRVERSGQTRGALFELGLAGIDYEDGQPRVGLTELGFNFAQLPNPTLDSARFDKALSPDEITYYVDNVVPTIPRELDCFVTLLGVLADGPKSVEDLDGVVTDHLSSRFSAAAVQTQKAGGLGRLRDLGLLDRKKDGLTAQFEITNDGLLALRRLTAKSMQPNGHPARFVAGAQ